MIWVRSSGDQLVVLPGAEGDVGYESACHSGWARVIQVNRFETVQGHCAYMNIDV